MQTSPAPAKADIAATQRVQTLAKAPAKIEARIEKIASVPAAAKVQPVAAPTKSVEPVEGAAITAKRLVEPVLALDSVATFKALPEIDLPTAAAEPVLASANKVAAMEPRPHVELSLAADALAPVQKTEPAMASPLGRLAKALASASVPPVAPASASIAQASIEAARAESKPIVANLQPSLPTSDAKRAPVSAFGSKANTSDAKPAPTATSSMTAALEKWNSSFDLGELSLMATGMWAAAPRSSASAKPEAKESTQELSGAEALSLITEPTGEETIASTDPTLKLEILPEVATKKLVANSQ
jgi:hypothetical protein